MKKDNDIIHFLFKKLEEDKVFVFNTPELKEIDREVTIADEELRKFINSRIHPKCRKKLNDLIMNYEDLIYDYAEEENELFFREGFAAGMNMVLTSLFII